MLRCFKKGWKKGCKPILGLNGCFLKGPYKSELLSGVGRDGNNQMFLIAWVVVEVESTDSWIWFNELLKIDLHLGDGYEYTIMSNQQKVMF